MLYLRFLGGAGGVLLVMMWIANAFLPQPEVTPAGSSVERPTIRITATTKGPERVVIDTTLPTVTPPATATAATNPGPSTAPVREAFAALPTEQSAHAEPVATTPAPKDAGKDAKTQAHKSSHRRVATQQRSPYNYGQQPQPYYRQRPQFAGNFFGFWLR